jgi:outer membrane scaffolding protein for murein synthesis (MipA/OmpV family)
MLSSSAYAGGILDYIRNYDLNDYALGVAVSARQSPYVAGENSSFAYPYLTSFRHAAFTDDWLILQSGGIGGRWTNDAGWILGGLGRIRPHGTSTTALEDLVGLDLRKWTAEVAPLVGWRGWPVHVSYSHFVEVFNRHGGTSDELQISYPREWDWGYLVPSATLIYNDATHNQYYYGVGASEIQPDRPAYVPGASNNVRVDLEWGYAIRDTWLLSGSVGYEWLDSTITESPIVERDTLWSANLGVAYNADIFQARAYDGDELSLPGLEIRTGIFQDNIDSRIIRAPADGGPAEQVDIEDVLGAATRKNVWQIEAIVRFGFFHRFEIAHFQLNRESSAVLLVPLDIGDETFPAGTMVDLRAKPRVTRLTYGFSLMNDAQKELGVMIGAHVTKFDALVSSADTGQTEMASVSTPLPVVGIYGSLALGRKTQLGARINIFRMEYDRYEGSLNYIYLGVQHELTDAISAGLGYSLYEFNLDTVDNSLRGSLRLRHSGPTLYASFKF